MTEAVQTPFFNIFANNGKRKEKTTFRVFSKDKKDEDVVADYYISNISNTAEGAAIRTKSKAGNVVISVQVKLDEEWWYGILNFSPEGVTAAKVKVAQPKGERAGVFGTFTNGDKVEKSASGWVKITKNGDVYLSCTLQEPYSKETGATGNIPAPGPAPDFASDANDGYSAQEIPF